MNKKEIMYSEVYSVIVAMGDTYIKKLPEKLYKLIESKKNDAYTLKINLSVGLVEQNINKEAISMLVLLYLNYWCNSDEEKQEINKILEENSAKVQKKMREMYSSENLFKNLNANKEVEETLSSESEEEKAKIEETEKGLFKKALKKINDAIHKK